jgi:hypothetical protein
MRRPTRFTSDRTPRFGRPTQPAARGSTLTAIVKLQVTNPGSGYSMDTPPTVVASRAAADPGATAKSNRLARRQNHRAPTPHRRAQATPAIRPSRSRDARDGTGAVAIAVIQPAGAVLVKEELTKIDDEQLNSIFVRVHRIYEVLPGPWIPYSRWDDELGPVQGLKRAVLFTNPPQAARFRRRDQDDLRGARRFLDRRDGTGRDLGARPLREKVSRSKSTDPTPEKFRADVPTTTSFASRTRATRDARAGPRRIAPIVR